MTPSIFKSGLTLTLALAVASGTTVAQAKDRTSGITIQGNPVVAETVGPSDLGGVIEGYSFKKIVSYANLDLSTSSGIAELTKHVRETARKDCQELHQVVAPMLVSDDKEDVDNKCVRAATAGAMRQVNAAIAAANGGASTSK